MRRPVRRATRSPRPSTGAPTAVHAPCTCVSDAVHMLCTCRAHAVHMPCTRCAHAIYPMHMHVHMHMHVVTRVHVSHVCMCMSCHMSHARARRGQSMQLADTAGIRRPGAEGQVREGARSDTHAHAMPCHPMPSHPIPSHAMPCHPMQLEDHATHTATARCHAHPAPCICTSHARLTHVSRTSPRAARRARSSTACRLHARSRRCGAATPIQPSLDALIP